MNDLFVYSGHFVIQEGRKQQNVLNKRTGRLLIWNFRVVLLNLKNHKSYMTTMFRSSHFSFFRTFGDEVTKI